MNDRQELASLGASSASRVRHVPLKYGPDRASGNIHALEKALLRKMLDLTGFPPVCFGLWDGDEVAPSGTAPVARVLVHDRDALLRVIANPDLQFGEMYSAGRLDVDGSLAEVMTALYRARSSTASGRLRQALLNWINRPRPNSLAHARSNIHHHYDIGNDFYRLWLDEQMVYTCAYFPSQRQPWNRRRSPKWTTSAASSNCKPGEPVVEAGCGWGALALHMARHYGAKVRAYNISRRAARLRAGAGPARGAGRPGRVHRGRLPRTSRASATPSSRSACWSTWASRTSAHWAR